jgi:hypothetical protein
MLLLLNSMAAIMNWWRRSTGLAISCRRIGLRDVSHTGLDRPTSAGNFGVRSHIRSAHRTDRAPMAAARTIAAAPAQPSRRS